MQIIVHMTFILLLSVSCQGSEYKGAGTQPPSHEIWNQLLSQYVSESGFVDYKGMIKEKVLLEKYLNILSQNPPDTETWTQSEQLAYWINAYNAFTVKLIVDNYPVSSIQDLHPTLKIPGINTVWHKKFFKIGGEEASLDQIEHKILRKNFEEPRIHFAINCASFSCPPLRNEAYHPDDLDRQLDEQARAFINDPKRNEITQNKIKVSKIFSWFKGDFTKNGSLIEFLNNYSRQNIARDAKISYMDYDWSLNEQ